VFRVSGFGFRVSGFGFRVSGVGCRVGNLEFAEGVLEARRVDALEQPCAGHTTSVTRSLSVSPPKGSYSTVWSEAGP